MVKTKLPEFQSDDLQRVLTQQWLRRQTTLRSFYRTWDGRSSDVALYLMSISLHIPDSVVSSLRIPEGEIETHLRAELAIALYKRGILSFGLEIKLLKEMGE